MIHPSYVDLMKVVNQGVEEGEEPVISSRYSIVMATARRARQLVAGDEPLIEEDTEGRKALSVAVEELNGGKIRILTDEEKAEMDARREEEARNAKNHGGKGAEEESAEEAAGEDAGEASEETAGASADEDDEED